METSNAAIATLDLSAIHSEPTATPRIALADRTATASAETNIRSHAAKAGPPTVRKLTAKRGSSAVRKAVNASRRPTRAAAAFVPMAVSPIESFTDVRVVLVVVRAELKDSVKPGSCGFQPGV